MKIFITGGAGFIGSRVCRLLAARGDSVIALVRANDSSGANDLGDVERVTGDLENEALLEKHARNADAVVHLALTPNARAAEIDRAALETLGRALANSGKTLIGTSAAGIVGDTHGAIVDEHHAPDPVPSVRWRFDNEAMTLGYAENGIRVCIVRPSPIVHSREFGGAIVGMMRKTLHDRGFTPFVGGAKRWSTAHVDEVAALYVDLLDRGASGETYFAASPELVTTEQIATLVAGDSPLREVHGDEANNIFSFFADLARIDIMVDGSKARALAVASRRAPTLIEDLESTPH